MEQPKKELIKGITDLFEDYEETYVPGEWESFSKVKKKKYPFFAPWMKIAAVFFLMASILPFAFNRLLRKEKVNTTAVIKPVAEKTGRSVVKPGNLPVQSHSVSPQEGAGLAVIGKLAGTKSSLGVEKSTIISSMSNQGSKVAVLNTGLQVADTVPVQKNQNIKKQNAEVVYAQTAIKSVVAAKSLKNDSAVVLKRDPLSTAEFLTAESRKQEKTIKKKEIEPKWDFGVQVMPAATSSNVNVGAGVTTAYRLSDKFSLSSGISFLQMQAGGTIPQKASNMASISSLSDKKLLAVDANLKAIDIPIALVYKLNKNFYTSAGVSYFNVISEKRSNTFEQTAQVDQHGVDPQTGYNSTFKTLFSEQVAEPTSEKHLKGNSYLGFFNFSIGRQQTLFNKYNIRIEPFIKIPVGKLSSEDLQLMNSGIKFQLAF